jgi:group I intron endonuclease
MSRKWIFPSDGEIQFCIYSITHKDSGKMYIGKTVKKAKDRWRVHLSPTHSCKTYIGSALKKYGYGAFTFTVIDVAEDEISLNHKEVFWIKNLNTISPHGYNLTSGGEGTKFSDEARAKMSKDRLDKPNAISKQVTRNDGKVFSTLSSAGRESGVTNVCITDQIRGKQHSTKGFQFKYGVHDAWEIIGTPSHNRSRVICSNGSAYNTQAEASKCTGVSISSIQACLRTGIYVKGLTFTRER